MVEPWIVVPAVAGSSPVDHPTTARNLRFTVLSRRFAASAAVICPRSVSSLIPEIHLTRRRYLCFAKPPWRLGGFTRIQSIRAHRSQQPLRPGDIYLIAFSDGNPVSCRALRKLDDSTAELRRMYILSQARRTGIDRGILVRLEEKACRLGYETLLLETGN